ncbi:MAG: hypothetical protein RMM98_00760, partial [Acidobacteriota bacterium]|nr:hypothetical protein [Acidobacteriota bacterium]
TRAHSHPVRAARRGRPTPLQITIFMVRGRREAHGRFLLKIAHETRETHERTVLILRGVLLQRDDS